MAVWPPPSLDRLAAVLRHRPSNGKAASLSATSHTGSVVTLSFGRYLIILMPMSCGRLATQLPAVSAIVTMIG
jgi:hypothetical protein